MASKSINDDRTSTKEYDPVTGKMVVVRSSDDPPAPSSPPAFFCEQLERADKLINEFSHERKCVTTDARKAFLEELAKDVMCKGIKDEINKHKQALVGSGTNPVTLPPLPPAAPSSWGLASSFDPKTNTFTDHVHTSGVLNYSTKAPFTANSIIRLASASKFLGTFGFLRMHDKGRFWIFDELSKYIPAFANTKVLEPVFNAPSKALPNSMSVTSIGTNTIFITEPAHGRANGDLIGIQGATSVAGIPASEINGVHAISFVNANQYLIFVTSLSTSIVSNQGGPNIVIFTLPPGSKTTSWLGNTYYYTLRSPAKPILIWHVLTQTVGYVYAIPKLSTQFGFAQEWAHEAIQSGLYVDAGLTIGLPDPAIAISSSDIITWANTLATVPMVSDPGTWVYGPILSVVGALIQIIDPKHRPVDKYLKKKVFEPLGMHDTFFFVADNDHRRSNIVSRIQTLYLGGTNIPVTSIPPIEFIDNWFYKLGGPKTMCFIDAGIISTLSDYQKFLKMVIAGGVTPNGKRLLSPAGLRYLSENHILDQNISNLFDDSAAYMALGSSKWQKWGLGVAVSTGSLGLVPYAGVSKRSIGWSGFFGNSYTIDIGNRKAYHAGVQTLGTDPSRQARFRIQTALMAAAIHEESNNVNAYGESSAAHS